MNKKGIIAAVLVLAVLAGLGYYFGGDSLQGRFDKISSGKKVVETTLPGKKTGIGGGTSTTSVTTLLEVTPESTYNTINLSEIDFSDENSQWAAVGKYDYKYTADATMCDDVILMLNDGTTSYQYQSWFADVFADVRLQYRDADDNFVQYVYADNTDKDRFTVGDQGLPTEGNFYVEVRAQETVESKYKDEKLYVYLSRICAEKDSDTFIWESENANSENQYFDFTADAVSGLMGGWAKIED